MHSKHRSSKIYIKLEDRIITLVKYKGYEGNESGNTTAKAGNGSDSIVIVACFSLFSYFIFQLIYKEAEQ
jgi:hypothetical protein